MEPAIFVLGISSIEELSSNVSWQCILAARHSEHQDFTVARTCDTVGSNRNFWAALSLLTRDAYKYT
jgi:hypothetical protein